MIGNNLSQAFQHFAWIFTAGWVDWVVQQNGFNRWTFFFQKVFQQLRRQDKIVLRNVNLHRRPTCQRNQREVQREGRRWNDHLVAFIDQRKDRRCQSLGCTNRSNDFGFWVIVHAARPFQIAADGFSQFNLAAVGGIVRIIFNNTLHGCLLNVFRNVKIRFANRQFNDAWNLGDVSIKRTNSRW